MAYLNTLSQYVDSAQRSTHNVELGTLYTYIIQHNNFLKQPLHIGLFVAAKDGKPLEVPTMDAIRKENPLHTPWDLLLINRRREYNEAQQHVIFEGWEVHTSIEGSVFLYHDSYTLRYSAARDLFELFILKDGKRLSFGMIKSISDLAEATQSNPLKLK